MLRNQGAKVKTLAISFLVCLLAAALCYLGLDAVGVSSDVAKTVSLVALGAFPKLREALLEIEAAKSSGAPPGLRPLDEYELTRTRCLLYVAAVGFSLMTFISGLGGVLAGLISTGLEHAATSAGLLVLMLGYPVLFLCGRWLGQRCRATPFLVALAAAAAIKTLGVLFDLALMSPEAFQELFGFSMSDPYTHAIRWLLGFCLFAVPLLLGVLVGRRQRLNVYLAYLLRKLPVDSRNALVELAYEEAVRIKSLTPAATPGAKPVLLREA
jgi:hypothetical protein